MRFLRLILAALALTTAAHAATGVFGDWRSSAGSVIRIDHCGTDVCVNLVQLEPKAPATTDVNNPDKTLRHRALCGLTIGNGFHLDDPTHLTGGHLYDPKSGHDYHGIITADGDSLHLRGYIGISLFGRSETWQRTSAVPTCHK